MWRVTCDVWSVTCDACLWTGFPDVRARTEFCLHVTLGRLHLRTNMETQGLLLRSLWTCKFANSAAANAVSKTCRRYGSYVLQTRTKFPTLFSGKVPLMLRTLPRMFLAGASRRPRTRKRTVNRQIPQRIELKWGNPPLLDNPRLPALAKHSNLLFRKDIYNI